MVEIDEDGSLAFSNLYVHRLNKGTGLHFQGIANACTSELQTVRECIDICVHV